MSELHKAKRLHGSAPRPERRRTGILTVIRVTFKDVGAAPGRLVLQSTKGTPIKHEGALVAATHSSYQACVKTVQAGQARWDRSISGLPASGYSKEPRPATGFRRLAPCVLPTNSERKSQTAANHVEPVVADHCQRGSSRARTDAYARWTPSAWTHRRPSNLLLTGTRATLRCRVAMCCRLNSTDRPIPRQLSAGLLQHRR